ncbi:MAG TPA: Hsp70 family protein, partial [Acidimicrobiales bacterium]|nr:Hsp70 family protein [Acidimicrobiales bacterium]
MTYTLGIDLGTTYSAAAVTSAGAAEIFSLSQRATVVPSVVFVAESGEVLVGDAALRRGASDPERLCREFKRRIGDSAPLVVGGTPFSAEALTGRLLAWIVRAVAEQRGGSPERIVLSYPANWGVFKQERLAQAMRIADLSDLLPSDGFGTVSEPEAAAISYASTERVPVGEVIAVYDLGGGTFDAAVLRKTPGGFEVLGSPEGIERLGGIDIDEAVYAHVRRSLGDAIDQLDPDDAGSARAVARLRTECIEAKEALSSDTEVSIPVLLPNLSTEVRITRGELEAMVRPVLGDSVAALRRAIASAGLTPDAVDRVLLVGGSSRMPLVAELVTEALGRPFFVDAHPKHAVALGAALSASPPSATAPAPSAGYSATPPGAPAPP